MLPVSTPSTQFSIFLCALTLLSWMEYLIFNIDDWRHICCSHSKCIEFSCRRKKEIFWRADKLISNSRGNKEISHISTSIRLWPKWQDHFAKSISETFISVIIWTWNGQWFSPTYSALFLSVFDARWLSSFISFWCERIYFILLSFRIRHHRKNSSTEKQTKSTNRKWYKWQTNTRFFFCFPINSIFLHSSCVDSPRLMHFGWSFERSQTQRRDTKKVHIFSSFGVRCVKNEWIFLRFVFDSATNGQTFICHTLTSFLLTFETKTSSSSHRCWAIKSICLFDECMTDFRSSNTYFPCHVDRFEDQKLSLDFLFHFFCSHLRQCIASFRH